MPAGPEHRQGIDPQIHHSEGMGQQLGERCGHPSGADGNPAQKAGSRPGLSPVHPDPHWHRLSDAEN